MTTTATTQPKPTRTKDGAASSEDSAIASPKKLARRASRRALVTGTVLLLALAVPSGTGVHAFGPLGSTTHPPSLRPPTTRTLQSPPSTTARALSNHNQNNKHDNDDDNFWGRLLDPEVLARRWEKADTTEMRNDATLMACYVLCRFLVYDVSSGAKATPGWELRDWIWISGTCSSAVVLAFCYVAAGLLSRTYESSSSNNTTQPVLRALGNVLLCGPVWLIAEHLLGFGPPDIAGNGGGLVLLTTGVAGLASFVAVAKTLTAGIR